MKKSQLTNPQFMALSRINNKPQSIFKLNAAGYRTITIRKLQDSGLIQLEKTALFTATDAGRKVLDGKS